MRKVLIISLLLALSIAAGAQGIIVNGFVREEGSREPVIGALVAGSGKSVLTNEHGYYSLEIIPGSRLTFSNPGYDILEINIAARKDTTVNAELKKNEVLNSSFVSAEASMMKRGTTSSLDVPLRVIKTAPSLMGETDLVKTLMLLPGVQSSATGLSRLLVRGGGPDENLLLLDGFPVYNAEHMLGLYSVFQTEAVKKVSFYTGAYPARYGGRISSVLDVRTKDGDMESHHGSFGISPLAIKLHLEGPLANGKTSYMLSARTMPSLFPILFGIKIGEEDKFGYGFYDVNAKVTHVFSDKDKLSVNLYSGRDLLGVYYETKTTYDYPPGSQVIVNDTDIHWGNDHIAASWTHVLSSKMFCTTVLGMSHYKMKATPFQTITRRESITDTLLKVTEEESDVDYRSGITDLNLTSSVEYSVSSNQMVRFGLELVAHKFKPESFAQEYRFIETLGEVSDTLHVSRDHGLDAITLGFEGSIFAEDEINFGRLQLNPGLRINLFSVNGKTYFRPQPRLSMSFDISDQLSVKGSYARMTQNIHLLSSTQMTLPMDLWVPVTDRIKPMVSDQYVAGISYRNQKGWEFSLEGYYKAVSNVVEYKDGVAVIGNTSDWEDRVEQGQGRSKGVELFVNKYYGKTTGWLSYTLSKTERRFPGTGISGGDWFPYKYDRRHILNMLLMHSFSKKLDCSASWSLCTGGVTTIPSMMTVVLSPDGETMHDTEYVKSRGNYRLPSSHSLNLGLNWHRQKRHGEAVWSFNVYNVYNHLNPDLIYDNRVEITAGPSSVTAKSKAKIITLLPVMPSIGYSFKF